jgi:hypothetical protein
MSEAKAGDSLGGDSPHDPHDEIARLEHHIEALAESAERCRKIILFSKAAIAAGGLLILAVVVSPFSFDRAVLVGAIAAVIGGIVALGSNTRTLQQIGAAMQSAEALRAELIDGMVLQLVRPHASGKIERHERERSGFPLSRE